MPHLVQDVQEVCPDAGERVTGVTLEDKRMDLMWIKQENKVQEKVKSSTSTTTSSINQLYTMMWLQTETRLWTKLKIAIKNGYHHRLRTVLN